MRSSYMKQASNIHTGIVARSANICFFALKPTKILKLTRARAVKKLGRSILQL